MKCKIRNLLSVTDLIIFIYICPESEENLWIRAQDVGRWKRNIVCQFSFVALWDWALIEKFSSVLE